MGAGALGLASTLFPQSLISRAFADDDERQGGSGRLLLRGGTLITLDGPDVADGDVLIEKGKIKAVGRSLRGRDAEEIDCRGTIVMPGFIDTHRHMWQGLLRNIGPNDLLQDYLDKILFGHALRMTPEEVYLGDLISAYSAMSSGITTILDWSHIANSSAHTDAAIQGLRKSGIRGVYGYGPSFGYNFPAPNPYPSDIRRLRKQYFSSSDQLTTLALAAAGPEFAGMDAAVAEWSIAREVGARISVHVGVGRGGTFGLLAELHKRAGLKNDTTYIHACTISDAEWDLVRQTGGTVSLAVPIEMQMGHGMPPIQQCLDRGIRPSLSVDVETNQPTDMFTQMRACFALQRALFIESHPDRLFSFGVPSNHQGMLTVRDMLQLATIEGARANGLLHKTGTLTPGKEADLIVLRSDRINVAPHNDDVGAVVLGMDTSNVDSVYIAGRAVKRNGKLVGVNLQSLLREAERARERLIARG